MESVYIPKGVKVGDKKDLQLCVGIMTDSTKGSFELVLNNIERNGKEWLKHTIVLCPDNESFSFEGTVGSYKREDFTFSRGRNILMNMGKYYDYMFMLDSDEFMADGLLNVLQHLVNFNFQYSNGKNTPISISIENMVDEKNSNLHFVTRLIPLQMGYKYVGRIHEQLINSERGLVEDVVTLHSNPCLLHVGYTKNYLEAKKKYERNISLLLEDLNDTKSGGGSLTKDTKLAYIYFNLMVTEYAEKNVKKSMEWFKCLELEINSWNIEKMFIQQGLLLGLQLHYFLEDFKGFYALLDKYEFLNKLPESHYLRALILKDCDELEKSRECLKKYWEVKSKVNLSNFPKDLQLDNKVKALEDYLGRD